MSILQKEMTEFDAKAKALEVENIYIDCINVNTKHHMQTYPHPHGAAKHIGDALLEAYRAGQRAAYEDAASDALNAKLGPHDVRNKLWDIFEHKAKSCGER